MRIFFVLPTSCILDGLIIVMVLQFVNLLNERRPIYRGLYVTIETWPHYLAKQTLLLIWVFKQPSSFVILPISNDLF